MSIRKAVALELKFFNILLMEPSDYKTTVYQLASQDFQLQAKNQNKEEKLHRCATIHYTGSIILRAYYVFTLQ